MQVTYYDSPDSIIEESAFGRRVTNARWSVLECARLAAKGDVAAIARNGSRIIAVFREDLPPRHKILYVMRPTGARFVSPEFGKFLTQEDQQ